MEIPFTFLTATPSPVAIAYFAGEWLVTIEELGSRAVQSFEVEAYAKSFVTGHCMRLGLVEQEVHRGIGTAFEKRYGPKMTRREAKYYFNVISASGTVMDYEGVELESLDDARDEALEDARFLMSAAILEGRDISARHIEVCNETGDVLMRIPFTDAITVSD
jgi:hypothetical protein